MLLARAASRNRLTNTRSLEPSASAMAAGEREKRG